MLRIMDFSRILYAVDHRAARITLNRPQKRNALDDVMIHELTTAFATAGKDPAVKVVLLAGTGQAFCAGADLAYLARVSTYDLEQNRSDSHRLAQLYRVIYELRKPTIAVVDGPALGGGCGLASVCDFVFASEEHAAFGYPEVRRGFVPAIVMVFLVKRVGEGRARELVVRGGTLTPGEAEAAGLVSRVVPAKILDQEARRLADELISQNSVTAMGLCKEILARLDGMNLVDALDFAANMNAAARMTAECKKGIAAFLNRQPISW